MTGNRDLGFPKATTFSLREQAMRTTLRNVRAQGHTYVEMREDGKRLIFFCTLCLSPCYSDKVLFDHLKGNLHTERYASAKLTLLGPNPWPFNDGVLFFHELHQQDRLLSTWNYNNVIDLSVVTYDNNLKPKTNGHVSIHDLARDNNLEIEGVYSDCGIKSRDEKSNNMEGCDLVIPGLLVKDEVCDLGVWFIGIGQIAARFFDIDGASNGIKKIWCEWLGKKNSNENEDAFIVPVHDFAVITFTYSYELGRKGFLDDVRSLLSSDNVVENSSSDGSKKRKAICFSDPEDISEASTNLCDSSVEESLASNILASRLLLVPYEEHLLQSKSILSKTTRRELRRQQRLAAERMCDICQHKMLPGKDVATIFNLKTGKLACSSRNVNGAFHVFHISCLIHWILLCEFEIFRNKKASPKIKTGSLRKAKGKDNEKGKVGGIRTQICSVFCPECQGTGMIVEGDELENPSIPLSEMFKYKIKVSDAHKAWMKSPEVLQNCSMGFDFLPRSDEALEEMVSSLKLLHFYRAHG